MEFLNQHLGQTHGGRLLDFGTGQGQSVRLLIDAFQDYSSIVGVDVQDPRERVGDDLLQNPKTSWLKIDGMYLPFADSVFDTVSIANVLHHLRPSDIGSIFSENLRVLKHGGRLVIWETVSDGLNEMQMTQLYFHHWRGEIDRLLGYEHNPTFTRSELTSLVSGIRLADVEVGEHIPVREDCNDPQHLNDLAEYMNRDLERIKGYPEYANYKDRYDELVARMQRTGFLGATTLIFIGKAL